MRDDQQRELLHRRFASERLRQDSALKFRTRGKTYQQIADELGYRNAAQANKAVRDALDRHDRKLNLDVTQWRELELLRLEELHAAYYDSAITGDVRALDRVLAIASHRVQLLGLDSPIRIAVEQKVARNARDLASLSTEELIQLQTLLLSGPSHDEADIIDGEAHDITIYATTESEEPGEGGPES